jgi:hypothetical protein
MDRPDEELDTELSKSAGDPNKSWADDISATIDQLEAHGESKSELDELFAPHMEALAAQGHTPASWARMAIGVGQQLEQQFAANPDAYKIYQGMVQTEAFNGEWDHFTKAHKDANDLRYRMGEFLQANPSSKPESMRQSLNRAYKAVKAASKEPRNDREERRQSIGDAWDQTYGGR